MLHVALYIAECSRWILFCALIFNCYNELYCFKTRVKNCNKVLKFNPLHSGNIMEECRVTCLLVPAHPFQQVVGELALLSNM